MVLHEAGRSRMLVGYVVADDFDQQPIKDALATRLPEFMVPQVIMEVPAYLPTTPNGKLDRRALPDPVAQPEVDAPVLRPTTPEEEVLVRIWREVLGVPGGSASRPTSSATAGIPSSASASRPGCASSATR